MSVQARQLYGREDLERLINPRTIAVVGASETRGSFGERTLANLSAFKGNVYAVNPKYKALFGRPCVAALEALPEPPDCVILCVARPLVEGMIEAAGRIGAGGAVIYASGFSETGKADRIAAQERLIEASRRTGVRLAGPNCVGLANMRTAAGMNFMPDYGNMGHKYGPIAIVSQSGALGYTVLQGMERGIGFSHYLAAGNSSDVDVCDFISYLAEDDATRAIITLFEGVKDGARFLEAARKARAAGKALIVYKAGNSEASGRAALSHTGTMVGSAAAYQAAFKDVGAVATDNLEHVLELASFFAKSGAPRSGRGVGVLATSGGAAVIAADKAELHGVSLPGLAPKTAEALRTVVPDFGSVANPSDLTAEVLKTYETFTFCLDAFLGDGNFSALVLPLVFAHASSSAARAPAIIEAAKRTDRPLLVVWMNEWHNGPGSEILDADSRVTLFRSMDSCFAALRAWFDWHEFAAEDKPARPRRPDDAVAVARRIIAASGRGAASLSEAVSKQVLTAYGIQTPQEHVAASADETAAAALRIGFPVAVKIASSDIAHKTEAGGIRLGLMTADAVHAASLEILSAVAHALPHAKIDGLSVQQMVPAGTEIVIGVKNDLQFGPLIAVGFGGILVELLQDTAVRLAPVSEQTAREMLASLKRHRLLTGFRGGPGVNIDGLIDTICRISELAYDLRDVIDEIDVNPVIAGASTVIAADALIVLNIRSGEGGGW